MKEFRFIGDHPEALNGGRVLAPGDFTGKVDESDDVIVRLLEDGKLIDVAPEEDPETGSKPKPKAGDKA